MKPRNKKERAILEYSQSLPAITIEQENHAKNNCFLKHVYRTNAKSTCFECGHSWGENTKHLDVVTCPSCGAELKPIIDKRTNKHSKARTFGESAYYAIVTTSNGFQVVRYFYINKFIRAGKEASYFISEAVQHWFNEKERHVLAKPVSMSFYCDNWIHHRELTFPSNKNHNRYQLDASAVWHKSSVLPIYERNGFKGDFHDIAPHSLLQHIVTLSRAETLLKAGQASLLANIVYNYHSTADKHWPSVKICMRNNYIVSDAKMWEDYLDLLQKNGQDLRNAVNVCPADLKSAHDRLVEMENARKAKELKEKAERKTMILEAKKRFFDLRITDGEIVIVVLDSIEEFIKEGKELQHCVYTNEYFAKEDSLVLSARKGEQRLETIEVNLKKMQVIQCRGKRNENSEEHDRILDLMKRNMKLIRKRNKQAA